MQPQSLVCANEHEIALSSLGGGLWLFESELGTVTKDESEAFCCPICGTALRDTPIKPTQTHAIDATIKTC